MRKFASITLSSALTAMLVAGVLVSAQQTRPSGKNGSPDTTAKATADKGPKSKEPVSVNPLFNDRQAGDNPMFEAPNSASEKSATLDAGSKDAAKKTRGTMSDAQSNPLYKETGNKGTNPLYERSGSSLRTQNAAGKTDIAPGGNHPADYKNGDDPITHKRPGKQN
jgi:hypothetical protein